MAQRKVDHLLIGAGVAGASCADELVSQAAGSILMVGRETDPPYRRPPITKEYLRGTISRAEAYFPVPEAVELMTRTSVTGLDPVARRAHLSNGDEVTYQSALIATGGAVRRLRLPGVQLHGIHYLRTLGNADSLRRDLAVASRVVCVGGSFVACEVAASLRALGKACTLVMLEAAPMERVFGPMVGKVVRCVLEEEGVEVVAGADVSGFGGNEAVEVVHLSDGRALPADLVVCGTGSAPDVALARKAGLDVGPLGGVACNSLLETSAPHLYAAGDMCEYQTTRSDSHARIEHEDVALGQGRTAARNMLGGLEPYDEVPHFWSEIGSNLRFDFMGAGEGWDASRVEGSLESRKFTVWYTAGGRVAAMVTANGHSEPAAAAALIGARE